MDGTHLPDTGEWAGLAGGNLRAHCHECEAAVDIEADEVTEGQLISCPECGADLEVVNTNPIEFDLAEDEDMEEKDDEEPDDDIAVDDEEDDEDVDESAKGARN